MVPYDAHVTELQTQELGRVKRRSKIVLKIRSWKTSRASAGAADAAVYVSAIGGAQSVQGEGTPWDV